MPIEESYMVSLTVSAKEAMRGLLEAMKSGFHVYDEDIQKRLESHNLTAGKELRGGADLVLCDSLYNARRKEDFANSEHEALSLADFTGFLQGLQYLLFPGGRGHMLHSAVQFWVWY